MCYNEPVSWGAFIIGTMANIAMIYLAIENNLLPLIVFGLAFEAVIIVQLFEALAWRGYEKVGANGVLVATIMQPIIIGLALLYLPNDSWRKVVIGITLIAYTIYIVLSLNNRPNFTEFEDNPRCPHLVYSFWDYFPMKTFPYLAAMLLIFLLLLTTPLREITLGFLIFTLALSGLLYPCAVGSLWCLFSAGLPIILILAIWLKPGMFIHPGGYLW